MSEMLNRLSRWLKRDPIARRPAPRFRPSLNVLEDRAVPAQSGLVYPGDDGQLVYRPDDRGDRIPDFSNVGYKGGTAPIPHVPVREVVPLADGDDTVRIQDAIDRLVNNWPLVDGFRGAVLLKAGEYQISGSLQIRHSGVVLRGQGDDDGGTVLRATGTSHRDLVEVKGAGGREEVGGSKHSIIDQYVPVGARSVLVDSTAKLAVGDTVRVKRPSTAEWIHAIHMDDLQGPWGTSDTHLQFDRVITRIEGDRITLDAPLTNSLDAAYGGGTINAYTWSDRIENVGVEHIRGVSDYVGNTDTEHAWTFISLDKVQNAWVRGVTAMHFAKSAVKIGEGGKWVTVADSKFLDPKSPITGGWRYSFYVAGELNLVRDCYAEDGRHDYVNDSQTAGPNVFVDSRAVDAHADTGPHHRWAVGSLFDNIDVEGNQINVQNRGNHGDSGGQGWAGANMVIWNSTAEEGFVVQNPPTAQNWLIGSTGKTYPGTMWDDGGNPHPPQPEATTPESPDTPVQPRSLYYAQLQDRLRHPGALDREYPLGDIDGFNRNGTSDDVYVDPDWRAAVDAVTNLPLDGFDVASAVHWVPFSFKFELDTRREVVVSASLSVGLRSIFGSNAPTDRIYIDGLNRWFTLAELGVADLPTTDVHGRVIDLSDLLPLLQDGRLNIAFRGDASVDWAVLNLRVAPVTVGEQVALNPAADAYVRDGVWDETNYGAATSLEVKKAEPDLNRQAFLRFNLSGVSGTVVWAAVRLVPRSVSDTVENAVAFVADDSWGEAEINWANKPVASGGYASWVPEMGVTTEFMVTPLVQEALAGNKRLSLKIFSTTRTTNGLVIYGSSEDAAAYRPRLVIVTKPPAQAASAGNTQPSREAISTTKTTNVSVSHGSRERGVAHRPKLVGVSSVGGTNFAAGTFTVRGTGADIRETGKKLHSAYLPVAGDVSILAGIASVGDTHPWATAGVMARKSLDAFALDASLFVTPGSGTAFRRRAITAAAGVTLPDWVYPERVGSTFVAWAGPDLAAWNHFGTDAIVTPRLV